MKNLKFNQNIEKFGKNLKRGIVLVSALFMVSIVSGCDNTDKESKYETASDQFSFVRESLKEKIINDNIREGINLGLSDEEINEYIINRLEEEHFISKNDSPKKSL